MDGLHGRRDRTREGEGLQRGPIETSNGHDHDRSREGLYLVLVRAGEDERVMHGLVVPMNAVQQG